MIALAISLLTNTGLLVIVGLAALESARFSKNLRDAIPPPPPPEAVATIFAEIAENRPTHERTAPPQKLFTRTSPDQTAAPDDQNTPFIGERDTKATSDTTPDLAAPPMPAQSGIDPKDTEIETTQSSYRDGKLTTNTEPAAVVDPTPANPTPAPEMPTPPEPTTTAEAKRTEKPEIPGTDTERSTPPVREKLLDGPNPVDVPVPRETAKQENIKPTPEKRPPEQTPTPPEPEKPAEKPKIAELSKPPPPPPPDPAFSGFQRKTALLGSISRTGRSALDVVDTPLGRYEAVINRAVELEFQRNCVRHRDFITPGFLTVRFFVEPGGKVRSVSFDGDMSTGEIQKGFTLNSIRNAEIPPMPPSLRKEYSKEPLELLFRFHF